MVQDISASVDALLALRVAPGIVCFPPTDVELLQRVFDRVKVINPLGVDPRNKTGFTDETYGRVASLVKGRDEGGHDFAVQADGGVWEKTRDGLVEAGADELVGGYPIFSAEDYGAAIRALREG